MDAIMAEVDRRRRAAIKAFLLIEKIRQKKKREKKRRLWSRLWLLRRDHQNSVLNILFEELAPEDPASFTASEAVIKNVKAEKWTSQQIELLIDAYQAETCLYAINQPNYHNKHLRGEALGRVCETVKKLRPLVTTKECSTKFHNLRNQFNIERSKVRLSYKSGTGTDNIYQPSLWYYKKLLFLESYVIPRKSINSLEIMDTSSDSQQDTETSVLVENSQQNQSSEDSNFMNLVFSEENIESQLEVQDDTLPIFSHEQQERVNHEQNSSSSASVISAISASTSISHAELDQSVFARPSSSSSTSGISSVLQHRQKKRKRQDSSDEDYAGAIHELSKSLKEPIKIGDAQNIEKKSSQSFDTVDGFVNFLGLILRSLQDEDLQCELMSNLTQMAINAKQTDLQRAKK